MLAVPWKVSSYEIKDFKEADEIICMNTSLQEFQSDIFEELKILKENVGLYKIKKGNDIWKKVVYATDTKASLPLIMEKPVSRAYYKLVEIIRTCIVSPSEQSFHMCEAPGGFIQAIMSEMKQTVKKIYASSRSGSDFPCFSADIKRLNVEILETKNNDIIDDEVKQMHYNIIGKHTCDLITADGAIDNDINPENNERDNLHLLKNQIIMATNLQKEGGTFIVKVFGIRLHITCQMIAVLSHMYRNVHVVKPFTSRGVNDERYIVCQGYQTDKIIHLSSTNTQQILQVDANWMKDIMQMSIHFANMQCQKLRHALCFDSKNIENGKGRGRGRGYGRGRGFSGRGRGHKRQKVY
jgi:23S rRNA U2552 (ribose-2'-O)-methylase RlmE/FtsJ